jgi:hypothetical protein
MHLFLQIFNRLNNSKKMKEIRIYVLFLICFLNSACAQNCSYDPCKNRGLCQSSAYGYICICSSPYTGANCEGCTFNQRF